MATAKKPSLATFTLQDLAQYTREGEGVIPQDADHWLFYVGRDDVHNVLDHLLSRISVSWLGNMFGYDDQRLNDDIMAACADPTISAFTTLDHSQAGGVHEATILKSDMLKDPVGFKAHFAIIETATAQISHTKGGVCDNKVGFEGSTNWSASGEGTFVVTGKPGGAGYKAQNNTLMVFTDQATISRFSAELQAEHASAKSYALAA